MRCSAFRAAALSCLFLFSQPGTADEVDDEVRFVAGLIDLGLPDLAEKVLARVLEDYPDRGDEAASIHARLLIDQGEFEEAEAVIRRMPASSPDAASVRLALANRYQAVGQVEQAKALFDELLSEAAAVPADENAREMHRDLALGIADLLERSRDPAGAADALERVLASRPDPEFRRRVQERQAYLYLHAAEVEDGATARLERAAELAGEIEYGGPLWVAKAAVIRAQAARQQGDPERALEILEQSRETIATIDQALRQERLSASLSPKAGYHYVRGLAYQDLGMAHVRPSASPEDNEAAKQDLARSLNEFARVLKTYGESDFAVDASLRLRAVEDVLLEELGATLKQRSRIEVAPKRAGQLFASADLMFQSERFGEAIDEYVRILNLFPETSATPSALTHLGQSYANEQNDLLARMVTQYLGERFAGDAEAGKGCLMLASFFRRNDQLPLSIEAYDIFVDSFPEHEKAPQVLYTLALQEQQQGNREEAERYIDRLLAQYPKNAYALKGLRARAWHAYERQEYDRAVEFFREYVRHAAPGLEQVQAMMLIPDCYIQTGNYAEAYREYREIGDAVDPTDRDNPYAGVDADASRIQALVEQAAYQAAYCLASLKEPEDKVEAFRAAAIEAYDRFVADYPNSELAPRALTGKGGILLELDRMEDATRTFEHLAKQYPDTPEGRNGLLTLVGAALDVGRVDVARESLTRMIKDPEQYDDEMFIQAGRMMAGKGFVEESAAAYRTLLSRTDSDETKQYAHFGLGGSLWTAGDCNGAIESLNRLVTEYPRTAFLFEAHLLLGKAYRACDRYPEAIEALTVVFRVDSDPNRLKEANFELAAVQEKQGRTRDAYASYLRLGLHPDPAADPKVAPWIRASILRSIELGMELRDYESVILMCDAFLDSWAGDAETDDVIRVRGEATIEQARQGPSEASLQPAQRGGT